MTKANSALINMLYGKTVRITAQVYMFCDHVALISGGISKSLFSRWSFRRSPNFILRFETI